MKSFRERNQLVVGAASIAILGLLFVIVFDFKNLPFIAHSYSISAEFADGAGLSGGDDVRVAGVKVGTVKKVKLAGDRVLVTLQLNKGVTIPRTATAKISLKTILGTKSVVIDARGTEPYLADGGTIPLDHTEVPFEIYQTANATVDLLTNVDGKQLNEAFKALAGITADPNRNFAATLKGAGKVLTAVGAKSTSLDAAIAKGEEVLASLDASTPDVRVILRQLNLVMEVLAKRRAVVRSLLKNTDTLAEQLGGLLRDTRPDLDTILNDVHSTLAVVDANLGQLEEALRLIGPSTEAFARIVYRGRWAGVCIDAIEATGLSAPLPVTLNIGTGGSAGDPVDCGIGLSSTSTSARSGAVLKAERIR